MPAAGARPVTERLFVAAWPDAATAAALRELPRPELDGVRWVVPEQWHVTLRFLGDCDRELVAARLAAATLPSARARLGPAVGWLGRQVVVPVVGVDELAAAVHRATVGVGEPPRPRFRGHLTLARVRRDATPSLVGHRVSGAFDVDAVALVGSELSPSGARYTTIATYPIT